MVITHHGGQCFKVTFGDLTLVFDPISKKATLPSTRLSADIVFVSRDNPDMNGVAEATGSGKDTFVISGPGEYDRSGITAQGFLTKSRYGLAQDQEEAVNTLYLVELEGMTILHAGALADVELPQVARESIESVDILFVPVGGDGVLDGSAASKLIKTLTPRIIIPMHWDGMGAPESLDSFLKEMGGEYETVDKLTLKKKDALEKDGAIIVVTH